MESINEEPTQAFEDGCPLSLLAYDSSAALSVHFPILIDKWLDAHSITALGIPCISDWSLRSHASLQVDCRKWRNNTTEGHSTRADQWRMATGDTLSAIV